MWCCNSLLHRVFGSCCSGQNPEKDSLSKDPFPASQSIPAGFQNPALEDEFHNIVLDSSKSKSRFYAESGIGPESKVDWTKSSDFIDVDLTDASFKTTRENNGSDSSTRESGYGLSLHDSLDSANGQPLVSVASAVPNSEVIFK